MAKWPNIGQQHLIEIGDDTRMPKTVLITDDTAFMRMTLKNVIQKNGYVVVGKLRMGRLLPSI